MKRAKGDGREGGNGPLSALLTSQVTVQCADNPVRAVSFVIGRPFSNPSTHIQPFRLGSEVEME